MGQNPFGTGPQGGAATATKTPAKKAATKKPATKAAAQADEDEGEQDAGPSKGTAIGAKRDPFALPSSGSSDYKIAEFLEELLLIEIDEFDEMVTAVSKGELQPYARVTCYRLENENEKCDDMLVFQEALVRNFKKVARNGGKFVLGRLTRIPGKGGKSDPYILDQPTEDEQDNCREVMKELGLL